VKYFFMFKALRDYFSYKPSITKEQFFTTGFAERKLHMACDVIALVRQEYREFNTVQQQKRPGSTSARAVCSRCTIRIAFLHFYSTRWSSVMRTLLRVVFYHSYHEFIDDFESMNNSCVSLFILVDKYR
jgi:hypothetical protein